MIVVHCRSTVMVARYFNCQKFNLVLCDFPKLNKIFLGFSFQYLLGSDILNENDKWVRGWNEMEYRTEMRGYRDVWILCQSFVILPERYQSSDRKVEPLLYILEKK